jgi:hypothetical protein
MGHNLKAVKKGARALRWSYVTFYKLS